MKKFILLQASVLLVCFAFGQHKTIAPEKAQSAFKAKFPTATQVKWGKESKTEYEAEFKLGNNDVSANFDVAGNWLETETGIAIKDLPKAITDKLATDYKGYKISEAAKIEKKEGITYEAEVKNGKVKKDLIFTADGKLLSKPEKAPKAAK